MKKKYMKFVIMAAVIVVATIVIVIVSSIGKSSSDENTKLETMKVEYSDKIFINGTVQTVNNKNIYLNLGNGQVDTVSVKDGQEVKAGDVLFTYKNDDLDFTAANTAVKQANRAKKQAESDLVDAKNALTDLQNQGVGEDGLKEAKAAVTQCQNALDQANDDVQDANEALNTLKSKQNLEVKADVNGIVNIIGSQEDSNSPYMKISSGDLCAKGTVNEKSVAKVKVDDTAKILVIATGKSINGKISEVSREPLTIGTEAASQGGDSSSSLSNYNVTLTLDNTADLINGYHVQATVIGADSKLEVSKDALVKDKYIFKVVNKKLTKVSITYKNTKGKKIAILSGIKDGDEIVTNPSKSTKAGMKVE